MKVLLSIKPEFVHKIFSGEKKYEYRRSIFKRQDVESIIVYSTKPEGKIVGELIIDKIIDRNIELLWSETQEYSGISYDYFKSYFQDKDKGYAIKIKEAILYDEPISPYDSIDGFKAPQSFCYIG
ncbi:ASCH domain-containing protein [Ornithinibacillus bavariensis]|uniref:ASCH domain-containing protein n=1 Tax=Ornithinibacillus bavariensis TaxID=545502 RepID=A0A919X939_9BACI|nr:ASCH domain-containing protein [Ornithinibacillus bavariensis]GIO28296.1 hypothetical protein J43TS3_29070 [Ornithinibacillus bavariensis]